MRPLLLTLTCLWFSSLSAQTPEFVHFTSTRTVHDLASDSQFVWAATGGGIVQYDLLTKQTTYYNRGNSEIPINEVLSIAIDTQGTRWLGTRIGLVRWQGNDFTLMNPIGSNGTPIRLTIHRVRVDGAGLIWMHTTSNVADLRSFDGQLWKTYNGDTLFNGLNKLDASLALPGVWIEGEEDTFYFFDGVTAVEHPLPSNLEDPPGPRVIYDWKLDTSGKVWFTSAKQLCVPNGGTWTVEKMNIWADVIALSPNGTLWAFDDYDGILLRHPNGIWDQITDEHNFLGGSAFQMLANDHEILCLGTQGHGLQYVENEVFNAVPKLATEMRENSVVDLKIIGTQTVWSIFGEALSPFRFQNGQWQQMTENDPNAPEENCWSMTKDGLDRLWVISSSKIYRYDGVWESIPAPVEFPWELVYSVAAGSTGNEVYFGGDGKIARYDGTSFQIIDYPDPNYNIWKLAVDQQGNIWVPDYTGGVGEMVARFDGQNWVKFTTDDLQISEFGDFVSEISVAPNGDVWVITPDEISKYDGTQWQKLPLEGHIYGGFNTIAFDGNEKVWIGCFNDGHYALDVDMYLIKIEGNDFQFYPYLSTPLPYPNITALAVDGHHNLWIGGEAGGIAVFNENGVTLGLEDLPLTKGYNLLPATAFPNPTSNASVVEYTLDTESDVLLELRSITGQLLQSKRILNQTSGKHQWPLSLNSLAQGTYCWRVLGEKSVANGTIIVKGH